MKFLLLHQQTGKSAKSRSTKTSADAPQSSQVKRKGPKSTKSQVKRQRTAPPSSPPPVSPIRVESSHSSPEIQTQQVPSPPQPQEAPQLEETSADVPEQTADPVSPIMPSVVPPEQTSIVPPQGKVPFTRSPPMDLLLQIISNFIILSVDIVPSATSADQPMVPSALTSQRREIALKQVSYLILILCH